MKGKRLSLSSFVFLYVCMTFVSLLILIIQIIKVLVRMQIFFFVVSSEFIGKTKSKRKDDSKDALLNEMDSTDDENEPYTGKLSLTFFSYLHLSSTSLSSKHLNFFPSMLTISMINLASVGLQSILRPQNKLKSFVEPILESQK